MGYHDVMSEKNIIKERKDIPKEYKWNLEKMYASDEDWNTDLNSIKDIAEKIVKYAGKIGESSENLLSVLELSDEISRKIENVYVYARMRKDEDNRVDKYQIMSEKAQAVSVEVQMKVSFITPEIINIPEEKIYSFLEENRELKIYEFMLKEIIRQKKHVLSKEEEQIVAQFGEITSAPENVFRMINNADMKFNNIKDENGEEVELTHGRYIKFLESENRDVRKEAFKSMYAAYTNQKNTIATTLNYSVKSDILYSRLRKYKFALEASLDGDNIPLDVYDNLIKTIHDNLDTMYRYVDIRKKLLNVDELHMYDIYTPMIKDVDYNISYEEAKEILLNALKPMGEEYLSIVKKGLEDKWVDVYENKGKTSGAYSFGTYDSYPYILMNYQNDINSLFTLAHEMGHSMHSYYSHKNQPYVYGGYKIFVAEVASTVNEALLMEYLLNNTDNKDEKMYLINHFLEQFRGTVYRQTMFAEFEKMIHEKVEQGEALTADALCNDYYKLNKLYFGDNIAIDDEIKMEWARIPHFYTAYYVYKYATGYSAAIALSQQILNGGPKARDRYIDFLKGGSSDYPINLLKGAGVDMTKTKPISDALDVFKKLVEEMESIV